MDIFKKVGTLIDKVIENEGDILNRNYIEVYIAQEYSRKEILGTYKVKLNFASTNIIKEATENLITNLENYQGDKIGSIILKSSDHLIVIFTNSDFTKVLGVIKSDKEL